MLQRVVWLQAGRAQAQQNAAASRGQTLQAMAPPAKRFNTGNASLDAFMQANCPPAEQLRADMDAYVAARCPPMDPHVAIKQWEAERNTARAQRVAAHNSGCAAISHAGDSIKVASGGWVWK